LFFVFFFELYKNYCEDGQSGYKTLIREK